MVAFCSSIESTFRFVSPTISTRYNGTALGQWPFFPDMDRLNRFFKDIVHYFDQKWDFPRDVSSTNRLYASPDLWEEIAAAIKDPGILHFSGLYMRNPWKRTWYTGARCRLYRQTYREFDRQTGIDVAGMFDARE